MADLLAYLDIGIEWYNATLAGAEWFWNTLTWLYDNPDCAAEMREALLTALRKYPKVPDGREEYVREQLLGCPKLATELAMTGGFDGEGMHV